MCRCELIHGGGAPERVDPKATLSQGLALELTRAAAAAAAAAADGCSTLHTCECAGAHLQQQGHQVVRVGRHHKAVVAEQLEVGDGAVRDVYLQSEGRGLIRAQEQRRKQGSFIGRGRYRIAEGAAAAGIYKHGSASAHNCHTVLDTELAHTARAGAHWLAWQVAATVYTPQAPAHLLPFLAWPEGGVVKGAGCRADFAIPVQWKRGWNDTADQVWRTCWSEGWTKCVLHPHACSPDTCCSHLTQCGHGL